jgi:hypothetical protein
MNCHDCPYIKKIKVYNTVRGHTPRVSYKHRYYCNHPEQKSKTPWICRGQVLSKGTPDEPVELGECPLKPELDFC